MYSKRLSSSPKVKNEWEFQIDVSDDQLKNETANGAA